MGITHSQVSRVGIKVFGDRGVGTGVRGLRFKAWGLGELQRFIRDSWERERFIHRSEGLVRVLT